MTSISIQTDVNSEPPRFGPMFQRLKPVLASLPIASRYHLKLTWALSKLAIDVGTKSTKVTRCYGEGAKDVFVDGPAPDVSEGRQRLRLRWGRQLIGLTSVVPIATSSAPVRSIISSTKLLRLLLREPLPPIFQDIANRIENTFQNEVQSSHLEKILPLIEEFFENISKRWRQSVESADTS
ncbi:uncharacterized protein BDZ83DRAFT_648863 [Colletotrichum acutatum]|uniref:Uncharacterized protein n=1 Tax=Glomerella acutata TaxID=27357 RepID=A0AAD8URS5_GLOAC|nr:uncharacterized protein BDZ83DRAFT_648863 [Colletotrichum acutatum]KAK1728298.1 hypothetical protein BDZ83DRAFT_648863 [Colletotrichum acutatum]